MTTQMSMATPMDDVSFDYLYAMRRDPLMFFTKLARDQGDIARFRIAGVTDDFYLLNHPDYIREVLVTQESNFTKWFAVDRVRELLGEGLFVSDGDFHLRQRKLAQPAFHRQRIGSYAEKMTSLALRVRERWTAGATVDIAGEMNWLAMMIVAATLFGTDVEFQAGEISTALSDILRQFERAIVPYADREDFESALSRLDSVVSGIIKQRRHNETDCGDLLSMLLLAEYSDGKKMTDRQLGDEVKTIFVAGHETSANALAWSWYLLSQNPEVEKKFHDEIDQKLADRLPTADDLPRLELTSRIFSEALRLYPPAWAVGRRAIEQCRIGDFSIAAGSIVIVSQYVTQRDARWFPDPARFDPDRWKPEARAARPRFSYFPFSAGSRSCLGEAFAGMEGALCLAVLAQKWKLQLAQDAPVLLQPQLTLRPRNGIKMRPEARH